MYAVKVINEEDVRKEEIEVLKQCDHKNIVRYVDYHEQGSLIFIVMELLNSSLGDALRSAANSLFVKSRGSHGVKIKQIKFQPKLTCVELFSVIDQCFEGLLYLHSKNIIHRDIYPNNILLGVSCDEQGIRNVTAKLCDFGLSKIGETTHQTRLQNKYSAPEAADEGAGEYTLKVDVFSLGAVIAVITYDLLKIPKKLLENRFVDNTRKEWVDTVTLGNNYNTGAHIEYAAIASVVLPMTDKIPGKRPAIAKAYELWKQFKIDFVDEDDDDEEEEGDVNGDDDAMDVDAEVAPSASNSENDRDQANFQEIRRIHPDTTWEAYKAILSLNRK